MDEQLLSIDDVAAHLQVTRETVISWRDRGYECPDGTVVRLRFRRFGKFYRTSRADLDRFSDDIAAASITPKRKRREDRVTRRRLEAAGLA